MNTEESKIQLNLDIAEKLLEIEDLCRSYHFPQLTRYTLIARDPANDEMIVVVTNEPSDEFESALDAAFKALANEPVRPSLADALRRYGNTDTAQ